MESWIEKCIFAFRAGSLSVSVSLHGLILACLVVAHSERVLGMGNGRRVDAAGAAASAASSSTITFIISRREFVHLLSESQRS